VPYIYKKASSTRNELRERKAKGRGAPAIFYAKKNKKEPKKGTGVLNATRFR
jgi:hypothetical protein